MSATRPTAFKLSPKRIHRWRPATMQIGQISPTINSRNLKRFSYLLMRLYYVVIFEFRSSTRTSIWTKAGGRRSPRCCSSKRRRSRFGFRIAGWRTKSDKRSRPLCDPTSSQQESTGTTTEEEEALFWTWYHKLAEFWRQMVAFRLPYQSPRQASRSLMCNNKNGPPAAVRPQQARSPPPFLRDLVSSPSSRSFWIGKNSYLLKHI